MDAISLQVQEWEETIQNDPAQQVILQPLLEQSIQDATTLTIELQTVATTYQTSIEQQKTQLQAMNAALPNEAYHHWAEKRYNEIALAYLDENLLEESMQADLRLIAQTCVDEGGKAVLQARTLCIMLFREYYGDVNCELEDRVASPSDADFREEPKKVLQLSPNPSSQELNIALYLPERNEVLSLRVLNLQGQEVYTNDLSVDQTELRLNVRDWPAGVYFIHINDGEYSLQRSFVVQK